MEARVVAASVNVIPYWSSMESKRLQQVFTNALGMACFFAYFVLLLFRYTGVFFDAYFYVFPILGICIGALYVASAFLSDKLTAIGPVPLTVFASMMCIVGALLLELQWGFVSNLGGGLCVILGFVLFTQVWGKNLSFYNHGDRISVLCATFILGALFTALSFALVNEAMLIALFCLPLLSLVHLMSLRSMQGSFVFAALEESRESYRFSVRPLMTTALTGYVWGIAFFFVLQPGNDQYIIPLCLSVPIILGGVVGLIDNYRKQRITEESLLKSFPLTSILAIAYLPCIPPWAQLLCGAYLFAVFTLDTMMCLSAMAETAHFNQLSPYWVFGISLAYYAVGAGLAYVLFGWAFTLSVPLIEVGVCLASIVLIVGMSDYVFTTTSYPGATASGDVITINRGSNTSEERPNLWRMKVKYVSDTYGLTSRQSEVLRMLSKGRNAQFVAKEFYISFSTAKAHIHNIYTKLNIHSQQELIDLVENAPVEIKPKIQDSEGEPASLELCGLPEKPESLQRTRLAQIVSFSKRSALRKKPVAR